MLVLNITRDVTTKKLNLWFCITHKRQNIQIHVALLVSHNSDVMNTVTVMFIVVLQFLRTLSLPRIVCICVNNWRPTVVSHGDDGCNINNT